MGEDPLCARFLSGFLICKTKSLQLLNLMECGRNTHDIVWRTRNIVGVAVRGSKSHGARYEIFSSPYSSRLALDPIQPSPRWTRELFPWVKAARAWRWLRTPIQCRVKLCLPCFPVSPVAGYEVSFTFTRRKMLLHGFRCCAKRTFTTGSHWTHDTCFSAKESRLFFE